MKYILYTTATITPEGVVISCSAIASNLGNFLKLQLIGAHILGIELTKEQMEFKQFQHRLALDAYDYSSN